ncbi:MAG: hypothetical protein EOO16_00340 [Chitinophagaceae bacterium]|nr:MAG: hypothetical protein EOO16_00340 [Chitinophagaceae bacterium]
MEPEITNQTLVDTIKNGIDHLYNEQKNPIWKIQYDDGYYNKELFKEGSVLNFTFTNCITYVTIGFSVLVNHTEGTGTLLATCSANSQIALNYDFKINRSSHVSMLIRLSIYSLETVRNFTVAPMAIDQASSKQNGLWPTQQVLLTPTPNS